MTDDMKRITMDENLHQQECFWRRRAGKPRMKWVNENCKYAYKNLEHEEFDIREQAKIDKLKEHAKDYRF